MTRISLEGMAQAHRATPKVAQFVSLLAITLAVGAGLLVVMPNWAPTLAGLYPYPASTSGSAAVYVTAVLGVTGSSILLFGAWLAPAWAIAWRMAPRDSAGVRSLRTLVLAFVLQPAAHALLLIVGMRDAAPDRYRPAAIFVQLAVCVVAFLAKPRQQQHAEVYPPQPRRWLVFGLGYLLLCAVLLPRLVWQDFNPDGLEVLTVGRSVSHFVLARLPTGELPGVSLGMATVAYPIHWVMSFLGVIELSARLPFLMYAMLVALGAIGVIEVHSRRRLTVTEFALALGAVLVVCLTLAVSDSYDPYSSDLASPASIDILALAFLLSACHFALTAETGWAVSSAVLLSLTRPSGPLLCGLLAVALFVTGYRRSERWRTAIWMTVAAFGVTAIYAFAMEWIDVGPMAEGADNLASRLRYLRFDDWRRWLWLIVPSGIVPVVSLLRLRSMSSEVRAIGLVILGYFALFYSLAFIALHHFAPVMLLPIVAYWRWVLDDAERGGRRQRALVALGVAVAAWSALPNDFRVFRESRAVGQELDYRIGRYSGGYADYRTAFEGRTILDSLFAPYWQDVDSLHERTAGPWVLIHYAAASFKAADEREYSVRRVDDQSGMSARAQERVAVDGDIGLFVADRSRWIQQRHSPPAEAPRPWIYAIPRTTLFRHLGVAAGAYQIDLKALLPNAGER